MGERERGRGSTVCVRAQEGSVKSLPTAIHPTNSPPTWNNSHKTCCRLPISSGCFPPWSTGPRSDYRGKNWTAVCLREGETGVTVQQGLHFDVGGRGLSICTRVFSDKITNSISKLKKIKNKEEERKKERDILISRLRRRLWLMSWKM